MRLLFSSVLLVAGYVGCGRVPQPALISLNAQPPGAASFALAPGVDASDLCPLLSSSVLIAKAKALGLRRSEMDPRGIVWSEVVFQAQEILKGSVDGEFSVMMIGGVDQSGRWLMPINGNLRDGGSVVLFAVPRPGGADLPLESVQWVVGLGAFFVVSQDGATDSGARRSELPIKEIRAQVNDFRAGRKVCSPSLNARTHSREVRALE